MATKIEVSEFARRINIGVKSQMGIRRLSNRALARGIKRSEKYVRERVNDEQEWRIADLERMCELWRMTFGQLTSYVDFKADHSHPEATGADSISSYQFVAVMDGDDIVQIRRIVIPATRQRRRKTANTETLPVNRNRIRERR